MSTKSREVIWGGAIMGAKIRAKGAREEARKALRAADRAEAQAGSFPMWKAMVDPLSRHQQEPENLVRMTRVLTLSAQSGSQTNSPLA
jgi:hypothetical protein